MKQANANYRWVILVINFIICAMAYAGLTMWGLASVELSKTFEITAVQSAVGAAILIAGYAVGSYVETLLTPKIHYRGAGLLGLTLMVIGTFGIPMASSYNLILVFRFFQGWGILWLVGVNSSVGWFPSRQRGLAAGVIGGGLTLGTGMGGWVANILIETQGTWQAAFTLWGFILLGATVIWGLLMKEPPADLYHENLQEVGAGSANVHLNPLKTVACWLCIGVLFFNCWQILGFNTILQGYLLDSGYSASQAATALLLTGLTGIISTPVGGIISDRLIKNGWDPLKSRAFTTAVPGFLVATITTVIFPFAAPASFGIACVMCILCGWGVPITNATSGALPMDLLQNKEAADKMFGVNILVGIGCGGVIAPIIAAAIQESLGWVGCFMFLAAGAAIGTVISIVIPKFKLTQN